MKRVFLNQKHALCPVMTKERNDRVLEAINKKQGRFDEEDKEGLCALANQVAVAVENANLYQQLKETFHETAQALAETIEKRTLTPASYAAGHEIQRFHRGVDGLSGRNWKT